MKKLLLTLLAVAVSPPVFAQTSGTITSSQLVCIGVSADHSTVGVQVTGTWTGTLQPQVAIQGQALTNSQVVPSTSTTAASTITANGVYYANVGSASQFCILGNTVASGSAVVFLNAAKGVNASTLGGGGAGSGTVTNSGNLVNNNFVLGAGATSIKDYGGSTILPANGGVASFAVAGTGFFFPAQVYGNAGIAASSMTDVANKVRVAQFYIPTTLTFTKITFFVNGAIAATTGNVAIYSIAGNLIVDSGSVSTAVGSTAVGATVGATTLSPGAYWLAWSNTASTPTVNCLSIKGSAGFYVNRVTTHIGSAANALSAGAMPATLGVITADGTTQDIPNVLLEP